MPDNDKGQRRFVPQECTYVFKDLTHEESLKGLLHTIENYSRVCGGAARSHDLPRQKRAMATLFSVVEFLETIAFDPDVRAELMSLGQAIGNLKHGEIAPVLERPKVGGNPPFPCAVWQNRAFVATIINYLIDECGMAVGKACAKVADALQDDIADLRYEGENLPETLRAEHRKFVRKEIQNPNAANVFAERKRTLEFLTQHCREKLGRDPSSDDMFAEHCEMVVHSIRQM